MRRFLSAAGALLLCATVCGQQLRSREPGLDEYRMLLEQSGYVAFSFDLTEFLSSRYDVAVRVKEYAAGHDTGRDRVYRMGSNKTMVSEFRPEQQTQISEEEMADPATRTYRRADRLTVGFYPSGVDSLAAAVIALSDMRRSRLSFELRGLVDPKNETAFYKYLTRPFRIDSASGPGRFIPLVFFGSMWYDRKWELFRFCGEREIAPDLSSEIVERVPHFYVIGVEFTERQE